MDVFVKDVRDKCREHGIRFYASKGKYLRLSSNIRAGGYFDDVTKTLAYAKGHSMALSLLAHESCHLDQFVEAPEMWANADQLPILDEWLSGKNFPKEKIRKCIEAAIALELDCEKRTVEKIKKYNLPIDIKKYIKQANTYLFFYLWLENTRRWSSPNNSPYKNEEIIAAAPSRFLTDYSVIPDKIVSLFAKYKI